MPLIVSILLWTVLLGGIGLWIWLYSQFEKIELASDMRQRIHDQLVVLAPGEFRPQKIGVVG